VDSVYLNAPAHVELDVGTGESPGLHTRVTQRGYASRFTPQDHLAPPQPTPPPPKPRPPPHPRRRRVHRRHGLGGHCRVEPPPDHEGAGGRGGWLLARRVLPANAVGRRAKSKLEAHYPPAALGAVSTNDLQMNLNPPSTRLETKKTAPGLLRELCVRRERQDRRRRHGGPRRQLARDHQLPGRRPLIWRSEICRPVCDVRFMQR
jgi:hypothetical protein